MQFNHVMLSKQKGGLEQVAFDYFALLGGQFLGAKTNPYFAKGQASLNSLSYGGVLDLLGAMRFKRLTASLNPDMTFFHGNRAFALMKNCFYGKKIAVIHNSRFKKQDLAYADGLIAVSHAIGEKVREEFPRKKLAIIHNALSIPSLSLEKRPEIKVLGALGRLHQRKGFDLLLEVIDKQMPLLIAGEGEERANLENLALHKNVRFLGWNDDKKDFFSQIDALIVPSRVEPFGLTIIEAMAYGVPVLASNIEGPKEIITHLETGLLFESENKQDLKQKLDFLIGNPVLAHKMAQKARLHVEENYSYARLKHDLLRFTASF